MLRYQAPLMDIQFLLKGICRLKNYANLPGFEDATLDTLLAVVESLKISQRGYFANEQWGIGKVSL